MPAERDNDRPEQDGKQKNEQGNQRSKTDQRQDAQGHQGAGGLGVTSVNTSDPEVNAPELVRGSPEQVVSFQTSQLPTPPVDNRSASGGDVVREQPARQKGHGDQATNKQNGHSDRQHHRNQRDERNGDHQRRRKHKKKLQQAAGQPNWKTMAMTALLALVCGVSGAWAYSAMFGPSDKQEKSSDKNDRGGAKSSGKSGGKSDQGGGKSDSGSSEGGASAAEIPGFNSAKDAGTFKKELEHLAHRLDLLGGRIDRMTSSEEQTPPVLHTIQQKVIDLERELDQVANLPAKISQLDRKVSDLKQEFRELKEQVTGNELPTGREPTAPLDEYKSAALGAAAADPADDATMKLAAGLLREGHSTQAYEVLRRLQRERPNDARVWYLSALAYGLATGEWNAKAKRFAEQGVACERAGHPSSDQIESALSGFSADSGTSWLAKQRKEARTR